MCYYSKTLRRDQFRAAKEGEDLTLTADGVGHHFATSEADGKIVCILPGTQLHIENFQLNQQWKRNLPHSTWRLLQELEGKPVSARFFEDTRGGYSADSVTLCGERIHLLYLAAGTKFYIGAKRVPMSERMGVDDPSIMLDHKEPNTSVERVMAKVDGLCSITR